MHCCNHEEDEACKYLQLFFRRAKTASAHFPFLPRTDHPRIKKKRKRKKKTYRQIFGVIRKSIHSFFLSSSLAPRIPSTMAKIKKKGLFSMQYFALLSSRLCLIPVLTLLRHLRPGQKLYHSYSGRAKASDFSAGFPSTMHLQGYVLYLQPEDRSLF